MINLIIGVKGTGKTKTLIDLVNSTVETSKGSVVCLEKGTKLRTEIKYLARLIDTDEYMISDAHYLFGFIAGICASNHDAQDIFIDSCLKICKNDVDEFGHFVRKLAIFAEAQNLNITMTSSIAKEDLPESLLQYVK